jgi:hypothetical protein
MATQEDHGGMEALWSLRLQQSTLRMKTTGFGFYNKSLKAFQALPFSWPLVLAFAAVDIENEDNWVWFLQQIIKGFPGIAIFMADAEKGITSHAFQDNLASISALSSRCARHLARNYRDNIRVKLTKEQEKFIITKIAKARTEDMCNAGLQELTMQNEEAAAWLNERKDEFVTFRFL